MKLGRFKGISFIIKLALLIESIFKGFFFIQNRCKNVFNLIDKVDDAVTRGPVGLDHSNSVGSYKALFVRSKVFFKCKSEDSTVILLSLGFM